MLSDSIFRNKLTIKRITTKSVAKTNHITSINQVKILQLHLKYTLPGTKPGEFFLKKAFLYGSEGM